MKTLLALGLAAGLMAAPAPPPADIGESPPEIEAVKWYNSPPLTLEKLEGKTVLFEVFRTW